MKSTTVHYANATLEIVFHVGTRLEPGNQEAALYRFKYIGKLAFLYLSYNVYRYLIGI